ncbi:MAG: efflux RND transporter periplasmic adaptor subunit [Kofleriaceae bacterium]
MKPTIRAILIAALVSACGRQDAAPPAAPPATQVATDEVAIVQYGRLSHGPLISGTLEASRGATLVARSGGTVLEIGAELGDRVREGTVLARIETAALGSSAAGAKAAVDAAEAQLEVARREAAVDKRLLDSGAITRQVADASASRVAAQTAALAQAKAQYAAAGEQLGDTVIRAPIDGVVARRTVKVGDVVAPGAPLYELIDPSSLRLAAQVPSDRIAAIQEGMEVRFVVRGYGDKTFVGTISRISPAADPVTRQLPILVDIPNAAGELRAGLYAQGRLDTETADGVIVPGSAIDESGQEPTVAKIVGDKVKVVPVELGLRDPLTDRVIVKTGLAPGDRVILRAVAAPSSGTTIKVS